MQLDQHEALVVTRKKWRYKRDDGLTFTFHPNMAALRVKRLQEGGSDLLITASKMQAGDQVLDCTLGMGADAIVSAYAVGEQGSVVALESQPLIAELVDHGLATYQTDRRALQQAMRRVQVVKADYYTYLQEQPDQSVDFVLFDPMFRRPVLASLPMQQLKPLANHAPLTPEAVQEACRVARKAVLFKERVNSPEFERLGFVEQWSSSQIAWGVRRKEEEA
jgi:hypothetical protein